MHILVVNSKPSNKYCALLQLVLSIFYQSTMIHTLVENSFLHTIQNELKQGRRAISVLVHGSTTMISSKYTNYISQCEGVCETTYSKLSFGLRYCHCFLVTAQDFIGIVWRFNFVAARQILYTVYKLQYIKSDVVTQYSSTRYELCLQ